MQCSGRPDLNLEPQFPSRKGATRRQAGPAQPASHAASCSKHRAARPGEAHPQRVQACEAASEEGACTGARTLAAGGGDMGVTEAKSTVAGQPTGP